MAFSGGGVVIAYFVLAGQSNMKAWFTEPGALDAFKSEFLRLNPSYSDVHFFNATNGGSAMLRSSAEASADYRASDDPVMWGKIAGDYWFDETVLGSGPALARLESALRAWAEGKQVHAVIWSQGEADTPYVSDENAHVYRAGLEHVLTTLMNFSGAPVSYIQALGDRSTYLERLHSGTDVIHAIQRSFAEEVEWAHLGSTIFDLPLRDSSHLVSEQYLVAATRMALAISTSVQSPVISSAVLAADGRIILGVELGAGQTIDGAFSATAFRLSDDQGQIGISAVEVNSRAGVIIITPAADIDHAQVSYASAVYSHLLTQEDLLFAVNSDARLPVHPFVDAVERSSTKIFAYRDGYKIVGSDQGDVISGFASDDYLVGMEGNDTLTGGRGLDRMYGGRGDDVYEVQHSRDFVFEAANEGSDTVRSSLSYELREHFEGLTLLGSANLSGKGNALANVLVGNLGSNRLYGLGGDDQLYGAAGHDRLDGGTGADHLFGGKGNDIFVLSDTSDAIFENPGEGQDAVYANVGHSLPENVERLHLTGVENLSGEGNSLSNLLTGNEGSNLLRGHDGSDKVLGDEGNDVVDGGSGADWLEGGPGQDGYYGGAGSDRFVFREGDFEQGSAAVDVIHDFSQSDRDRIRLDLVDADTHMSGHQRFTFIGTHEFSGSAGEIRFEQTASGTLVLGDTNGDRLPDLIISLSTVVALDGGDFII